MSMWGFPVEAEHPVACSAAEWSVRCVISTQNLLTAETQERLLLRPDYIHGISSPPATIIL